MNSLSAVSALVLRRFDGDNVCKRLPVLARLAEQVFGKYDPSYLLDRYPQRTGWCLFELVDKEDVSAAFKLGHYEDDETFYSWLGGVAPQWRGAGLGRILMQAQHDWARCQGYRQVTTRTQIGNDRMAALNVAAGFEERGTITKDDGRTLNCFSKTL